MLRAFYLLSDYMSIIEGLMNYWMTEKEAKVYLLCLEYGTIQPAKIAKISWLNRTSCYDIVETLVHKGVLITTQQQWTKKYSAINPELLFEQLQQKFWSFETILPALINLWNKYSIRPKVKIYEWIAWMKQVYMDTLSSETEILAFVGNQSASDEILQRFQKSYVPLRREKKIYAKVILCPSPANEHYHELDKENYRESRFLKDDAIEFGCELNFYGTNKVMIALYNESDMCGVIIESEHLYKTVSWIFGYLRKWLWA